MDELLITSQMICCVRLNILCYESILNIHLQVFSLVQ